MKVNLVPIGNSRGVRLPSSIIKECGFGEELDLSVVDGRVVLAPLDGARAGWDEAFRRMAELGDDAPLHPDSTATQWDDEEWTW